MQGRKQLSSASELETAIVQKSIINLNQLFAKLLHSFKVREYLHRQYPDNG